MKSKKPNNTAKIQQNLVFLFFVFAVGFGLQALINFSVDNFIANLDQKARNAEVQNQLGNEILLEIDAIEIGFYQLSSFPNAHLRKIIRSNILESEEEIFKALYILNKGGEFDHELVLNLPATPSLKEKFIFKPTQPNQYDYAQTDMASKFNLVNQKFMELNTRLEELDRLRLEKSDQLAQKIGEFKIQLKFITPVFQRLRENVNEIFYENYLNVRAIKEEVNRKKNHFHRIQLFLVILMGLIAGYFFLRLSGHIKGISRKLEDDESYLKDILSAQSNIIVVNNGQKIIDVSGGFFKFFKEYKTVSEFQKDFDCVCDLFVPSPGYVQKEMEGQPWVTYIAERPHQLHKAKLVYRGKEYIFQVSVTRSRSYGRCLISMFDITEIENINHHLEIERNRALAATTAKSDFLANMSHEIRTPLNGILGFLELLKSKPHDSESQKYLETISQSSHSLLGVINDILDFSKIESGKLEVEPVAFYPSEEFQSTAELFRAKCDEKDIRFEIALTSRLPTVLKADLLRIKQILNNLLSNAVKFTESGKKIRFKVDYNAKNSTLEFWVEDEGIGIAEDKLQSIFESFTQAESSTTRKYGGTGLGLAISAKLTEMLGGTISVESTLGQGSCFQVTLPVIHSEEDNVQTSLPQNRSSLSGHILLVEDNSTNQLLMGALLDKFQLTHDLAKDGNEAIEKIQQATPGTYQLILMDENMPNLNGMGATAAIREWEVQKNIRSHIIIALTANAMKGDKERFLEAGMDDYLPKPVDVDSLHQLLVKYLNGFE